MKSPHILPNTLNGLRPIFEFCPINTKQTPAQISPRACSLCEVKRDPLMARGAQPISRPWVLELVPVLVVLLIAAHVLALAYWIYRLATDNRSQRSKHH